MSCLTPPAVGLNLFQIRLPLLKLPIQLILAVSTSSQNYGTFFLVFPVYGVLQHIFLSSLKNCISFASTYPWC